jgi:hypothetical protein
MLNWTVKPGGDGNYTDVVAAILAAISYNATGQSDVTITTFPGAVSTSSGTVTIDTISAHTYQNVFNLTVVADTTASRTDVTLPDASVSHLDCNIEMMWDFAQSGANGGTLTFSSFQVGGDSSVGGIKVITPTSGRIVFDVSVRDKVSRTTARPVLSASFDNTSAIGTPGTIGIVTFVNTIYSSAVTQTGNVYICQSSTVGNAKYQHRAFNTSLDMTGLTATNSRGHYPAANSNCTFLGQYNIVAGRTNNNFANLASVTIDPTSGFNTSTDTTSKALSATNYATGSDATELWPYRASGDYRLRVANMTNSSVGTISLGAPLPVPLDINGATRGADGLVYGGASLPAIVWHVETTGNDATGNGSQRLPFASPMPAGKAGAFEANAADTISMGAGNFFVTGTNQFYVPGCMVVGISPEATTLTIGAAPSTQGVNFGVLYGGTAQNFTIWNSGALGGPGYCMHRDTDGPFPPGYNDTQGILTPTTFVFNNVPMLGGTQNGDGLYFWWSGSNGVGPFSDTESGTDLDFDPPPMTIIYNGGTITSTYDATQAICNYATGNTMNTVAWPGLNVILNNTVLRAVGPYAGNPASASMTRATSNYSGNFTCNDCTFIALNGGTSAKGNIGVETDKFGTTVINGGTIITNSTRSGANIYDAAAIDATSTVILNGALFDHAKTIGLGSIVINNWAGYPLLDSGPTLTKSGSDLILTATCQYATTMRYGLDGGATWTSYAGPVTLTGYANKSVSVIVQGLDANGNVLAQETTRWTANTGNTAMNIMMGIL